MSEGLVFHKASQGAPHSQGNKVKTKARKKSYITGAHESGSAKMKAEIRQRRKNRKSQQKT